MGLLKDVTIAIGDAGGNILSAATSTNREGIATLRFMVEISDASGLDRCLLPSAVSIRSTTLAVLCPAKAELSSSVVCRCESLSAS